MSDLVRGRCHCGAVNIEVPHAAMFTFSCHCSDCRKLSSGGRLLGHGTSLAAVKVTGDMSIYTYQGDSGKDVHLHFCPLCSTQIYGVPTAHPDMAAVRASLLDNEAEFAPMQFIFTDEAYDWDKTA